MFIVESDNFLIWCTSGTPLSQRVKSGVLRLGSVIVEALFASVAVIYSCALVYVLSGPLEIATMFVN